MLNKDSILEYLKQNRDSFKSDFNVTKLGLIGSFARDEQTDNSDIDLLLEFEPGTDDIYNKKIKIKHLLKSSFQREVDICREKYIKPYIRNYLMNEVIYV